MTALVLIILPLYLLATAIAATVVFYGARYFTKSKWPHRIVLAAAIGWPAWDLLQTQLLIAGYCDEYGKGRVYEVVNNVEGIYISGDRGCDGECFYALTALDKDVYRYVEARATTFKDRGQGALTVTAGKQYEDAFVPGPGLYRFSVKKRGHPSCQVYEAWFAKRKGLHSKPSYQNTCIATVPVDRISAQYEVISKEEHEVIGFDEMDVSVQEVRRISDQTLIFEVRKYYLWSQKMWSQFGNPHSCELVGQYLNYRDALIAATGSDGN